MYHTVLQIGHSQPMNASPQEIPCKGVISVLEALVPYSTSNRS